MDLSSILALIADPKVIALFSPVLVSALKRAVSVLPKWSLPVLSIVVGAVASALAGGDVATGAAAGLAGIGIREAVDQAVKTAKPSA